MMKGHIIPATSRLSTRKITVSNAMMAAAATEASSSTGKQPLTQTTTMNAAPHHTDEEAVLVYQLAATQPIQQAHELFKASKTERQHSDRGRPLSWRLLLCVYVYIYDTLTYDMEGKLVWCPSDREGRTSSFPANARLFR